MRATLPTKRPSLTLIELLVVVVILVTLSAAVIPAMAPDMEARRLREAARGLAQMSMDPTYYNLTPAELSELDFGDYFDRMREHMWMLRSFRLPDGLVSWGRAFSLLYGLAAELAPGIRPLDIVGPYVLEFLQGRPPAEPGAAR